MPDQPTRHPNARRNLGHTVYLGAVRLHPDLVAYVDAQAEQRYCSRAEYIRQLIVADKLSHERGPRWVAAPTPGEFHD